MREFQKTYQVEARMQIRSASERNPARPIPESMLQNTGPCISRGTVPRASRLHLDARIRFRTCSPSNHRHWVGVIGPLDAEFNAILRPFAQYIAVDILLQLLMAFQMGIIKGPILQGFDGPSALGVLVVIYI